MHECIITKTFFKYDLRANLRQLNQKEEEQEQEEEKEKLKKEDDEEEEKEGKYANK